MVVLSMSLDGVPAEGSVWGAIVPTNDLSVSPRVTC